MTTVYDMTNVSLYQVRLDQKDYRWIAVTKDDNEAIELCRAIVRLEREGHIVQDVFAVSPNGVSVAMNLRGFKEFRQAEKEPETKVVDAMFRRYCASGAYLDSHCKADLCSHRVFDIEICGAIADDDEIGECDVVLRGEDGEEHEYEAILLDDEGECSLEPDGMVFEAIQKACKEHTLPNFFWECNDCDAKTLDDALRHLKKCALAEYLSSSDADVLASVLDRKNVADEPAYRLFQMLMGKFKYMSIKKFDEMYESFAKSSDNFTHY